MKTMLKILLTITILTNFCYSAELKDLQNTQSTKDSTTIQLTNKEFQEQFKPKTSGCMVAGRVALGTVSVLCLAQSISLAVRKEDEPAGEKKSYMEAGMYVFGGLAVLSGVGFVLTF